jgi:hypothetical protein
LISGFPGLTIEPLINLPLAVMTGAGSTLTTVTAVSPGAGTTHQSPVTNWPTGTAWLKVHVMPSLDMEEAVPGGGGDVVTATIAVADLEVSATLVAVTV